MGTPHPTGAPSPSGQEIDSAATPWKWGEAPASRAVSGTAPGLSAWGRGLGGGRGSEAPKPSCQDGLQRRRCTLRTYISTLLASCSCGSGLPRECGPWDGLAPLGTHLAWGNSSSRLARPDLGSQKSKGCWSPKPGCFLACNRRGWGAIGD